MSHTRLCSVERDHQFFDESAGAYDEISTLFLFFGFCLASLSVTSKLCFWRLRPRSISTHSVEGIAARNIYKSSILSRSSIDWVHLTSSRTGGDHWSDETNERLLLSCVINRVGMRRRLCVTSKNEIYSRLILVTSSHKQQHPCAVMSRLEFSQTELNHRRLLTRPFHGRIYWRFSVMGELFLLLFRILEESFFLLNAV